MTMTYDEMIHVIRECRDGKQIQACHKLEPSAKWEDVFVPTWDFDSFDYRVKPEPREWWIVPNHVPGGPGAAYTNPGSAEDYRDGYVGNEVIHVREVME